MNEQPPPEPGKEDVVDRLIEEFKERRKKGTEHYGTSLKTFNGRNALKDALEEALDLCCYLMQAIMEDEKRVVKLKLPPDYWNEDGTEED